MVDYTREDFATKYSAPDLHFDAIVDLVGGTLLCSAIWEVFAVFFSAAAGIYAPLASTRSVRVAGDVEVKSYSVLKPGGTFAHIRSAIILTAGQEMYCPFFQLCYQPSYT